MPSLYTQKVYDGTSSSARDFVLEVARSFFWECRDSSAPLSVELVSYDLDTTNEEAVIARYEADLEELHNTTLRQAEAKAEADYEQRYLGWVKHNRANAEIAARYDNVISKVEAWQTDAENAEIKDFALETLIKSKDYDCYSFGPPQKLSGMEWLKRNIEVAERRIAWAKEDLERKTNRKTSPERVKNLLDSLEGLDTPEGE